MERSEPALVPEWLRCTANGASGTCSPHSDVSPTWNTKRAAYLERNHSSNSRRSSGSNGSTKHPYSSFNTSHRNNKDRSASGDGSLENILGLSGKNNSLRRSQSLVSRRTNEVVTHKTEDLKNNRNSANGIILGGSNLRGAHKAAFDKDFPSLGNEGSGIGRVLSPVQSLPVATAGLLGGEKWTSALAGMPSIIANTSTGSSTSGASTPTATLNMAEALSQVSQRAIPQVPDKAVRLEELAIKQSRQLIPMTPSMPKISVLTPSEKLKQPKAIVRSNEVIVPVRSLHQPQQNYSSQVSNQPRAGQVKYDASNASHAGGKFLVLKAAREHITNSSAMDASCAANNGNSKPASSQFSQPPTAIAITSNIAPKASTLDKKAASLSLNPKHTAEKKYSLSQAQSRSDFFNLMRKKTFLNTSSPVSDSSSTVPSHTNKTDGHIEEAENASATTFAPRNGDQMIGNGDSYGTNRGGQSFTGNEEKNASSNGDVYPDEEEAAFLRSLGWEENGEEVEITDEEIVAFYEEYQKLMPSLKVCKSIQPKCSMLPEFHSPKSVAASSESGSVGSEFEV